MQKRAEKQGGAPPSGGPPDGLAGSMNMLRGGVVHIRRPANDNPLGPWRRLAQPKVLLLVVSLVLIGLWALTR